MNTLFEIFKRKLFWLIARTCFTLYRWFPIFGSLRASIAIIYSDGKFLVIQRNDGRGLSLPGGIAGRRESLELALHREVREETGLNIESCDLQMQYHSDSDIPCDISVYRVQASGEVAPSWEGRPSWMTIDELQPRLLKSQQPTVPLLKQISANPPRDEA